MASLIADTDFAKAMEVEVPLNKVKKKDDTLTTSPEEALEAVREYFQDLFTPRQRPPNREPIKMPNIGGNKSLIKPFTIKTIKNYLKKLEANKACGPDNIPYEALKIGYHELAPFIKEAFNIIISTGQHIPSWSEGLMYLLYKGKGDPNDLKNYRGITVNNCISKVFSALINKRLSDLLEKRGILGQIQNGGRKNRQGLDSLFVLRTILEKKSGNGHNNLKDLSLLFIDLAKAFDKVPHDLLWSKMSKMGFHKHFIDILKSLYKDAYVTVMVNGQQTRKIWIKSGVKQGCPLSPLLWALFISDIALMIEKFPYGVVLKGHRISGLFFVDDLALVGKSIQDLKEAESKCQYQFELNGLEINFAKSKVLTRDNFNQDTLVWEFEGNLQAKFEVQERYKYLGVTIGMGTSAAQIFGFQRKTIVTRLKSFAGSILRIAKDSFDPIQVGVALWQSTALESVLYGIQIASVTDVILKQMDSIQANFCADLMQVRRSSSHAAIFREMGLKPVSSIVMQRKLLYWCRLNKMQEETWARKALDECFSNAWTSKYKTEIQTLLSKCPIDPSSKPNRVIEAISNFSHRTEIAKIKEQRAHSLKYFPDYPSGMGRQAYISYNEESSTISKFRLGNADLGNRDNPPILVCPACSNGPNDELHLAFNCTAMDSLRQEPWMKEVLHEAVGKENFDADDPIKLGHFLGGDMCSEETLHNRGKYLNILLQKHLESR